MEEEISLSDETLGDSTISERSLSIPNNLSQIGSNFQIKKEKQNRVSDLPLKEAAIELNDTKTKSKLEHIGFSKKDVLDSSSSLEDENKVVKCSSINDLYSDDLVVRELLTQRQVLKEVLDKLREEVEEIRQVHLTRNENAARLYHETQTNFKTLKKEIISYQLESMKGMLKMVGLLGIGSILGYLLASMGYFHDAYQIFSDPTYLYSSNRHSHIFVATSILIIPLSFCVAQYLCGKFLGEEYTFLKIYL